MSLSAQEAIAAKTEEALQDFLRAIRRMPADKLDWQPLGQGRTALDQLRECATAPRAYLAAITDTPFVSQREIRNTWGVDECEIHARSATQELVAAIRGVSDEELQKEVIWPHDGPMPLIDVLWMHLWNLDYHLGQVNYIQTLYGDTD